MLKKIILIMLIFYLIPIISYSNLDKNYIEINGKKIDSQIIYKTIDKKIDKKSNYNLIKKKEIYYALLKNIYKIKNKIGEKNSEILKYILINGYKKNQKEIDIYYSKIHKISLGYSTSGKEIIAYYKGNPENGYFGIFSNIHGGYEYGTYNSAHYLLDELKKSNKTGWFLIPTINPDGLEYYLNSNRKNNYYIKGRGNSNNVDINRNFCTKNFELKNYIKKGALFKTGIGGCESENETKIIVEVLKKFKFNKVVSLHSEGNIFFIPDNSFDDIGVRGFGSALHKKLPTYRFDLSYSNEAQKKQKIYNYEVDEGGGNFYTGTMETYIYEKYNIPVILIELKKHGEIAYELINILELIN